MSIFSKRHVNYLPGWLLIGALLTGLAALLAWISPLFGYAYELEDLPALPLAGGLVFAGALYLCLLPLINKSLSLDLAVQRKLLAVIILLGSVMRALLLWSEPALEDDYQRYLWDGAVTAHGLNPYALAPRDAAKQPPASSWYRLAAQSGVIKERINHSYLKTIYPPVAQGAFALAHLIKPWSLIAWRLVCLAGEAATLMVLLLLLRDCGRSPLWLALYWWNPVVIKELMNSAHMEAIVTPFILAAFALAIRRHLLPATFALGLAMGAKIWPALLAPLLWRQILNRPIYLAACVALLAAMAGLAALPPVIGGIDNTSGFVAYAQRWKTGSALFPQIEALTGWLFATVHLPANWVAISTRTALAGVYGLIILALVWRPVGACRKTGTTAPAWSNNTFGARDLMQRGAVATAALFLLSPSQFPWYSIWFAPFLCFLPSIGLMAITALIPLYYTAFYFIAIEQKDVFRNGIVWIIWLPLWSALLTELWWYATAWRRWGARMNA